MRVQKEFKLPSKTKQSFKDECNINNIMNKYMKDGLIEHTNEHRGKYINLPEFDDYHDALNQIQDANEAFASLTSQLRGRFENDPAKFLEFVLDENNRDEINSLGLGVIPDAPAPASPAGGAPTPEEGASPPPA